MRNGAKPGFLIPSHFTHIITILTRKVKVVAPDIFPVLVLHRMVVAVGIIMFHPGENPLLHKHIPCVSQNPVDFKMVFLQSIESMNTQTLT